MLLSRWPDNETVRRLRVYQLIQDRNLEELDLMMQKIYDEAEDQSENHIIGAIISMKEIEWRDGIIELCERWRSRRKDFIVSDVSDFVVNKAMLTRGKT